MDARTQLFYNHGQKNIKPQAHQMTAKLRPADPRLHLMMFLQYAVYGIWIPLASRFLSAPVAEGGLGFTQGQKGMVIAVAAGIGAICAPFIAGQIADRYFSTQRCLGVLLILGGMVKFVTAYQTSYSAWLWLSIGYAVLYMPTQALTNSLAMTHLADSKRQFPGVRVLGTIGWITVAWLFPMIWLQTDLQFRWLPPFFTGTDLPDATARMIDSLKAAGLLSVVYGLYCWFCLPNTPPKRDAAQKIAFAKAFALVRYRSFAVLLLVSLLISILHFSCFIELSQFLSTAGLADAYLMPAMTIGQFAEILMLSVLGLVLGRLGFRTVLTIGCFCFFLRCAIFGTAGLPLWAVVATLGLHGICFSCFVATAFIYVDRIAPDDVRHSAQTTFMLVFFGIGPMLTGLINGQMAKYCAFPDGGLDYTRFWYALAAVGLLATILVGVFFRDQTEQTETVESSS